MKRMIALALALLIAGCNPPQPDPSPVLPANETEAANALSALTEQGLRAGLPEIIDVARACQPVWPSLVSVYGTPDDTTTADWHAVAAACDTVWPSLVSVLHSPGFGWTMTPIRPAAPTARLHGTDLAYLGAFLLPQMFDLTYCDLNGGPKAYRPDGGGSLFGTGHAQTTPVFECSIPTPGAYPNLPTASLIQQPKDIRNLLDFHYIRAMGYYNGQVILGHGDHFEYNRRAAHAWVAPDGFGNPAGSWYVGTAAQVQHINTDDYIFEIPKAWADEHTPGMYLACGRYRRGQRSAGPTIIAYSPWLSGNPPAAQTTLQCVPLVRYDWVDTSPNHMTDHCKADTWSGGAWLTSPSGSAVIIVGCKGYGTCWYGWNGQPGDDPHMTPHICGGWPGGCQAAGYPGDRKGYHADSYRTEIMFYDPDDLAAVAAGSAQPWAPQPYERFDITPWMVSGNSRTFTGGVAYDREGGRLWITEQRGLSGPPRPVVHVWKVR